MTPRQRKPWTKVIEESGISIRLHERAPGSRWYREVRLDGGLLTTRRSRSARVVRGYLLARLRDHFPVAHLSQSHLDAYAAKRRSGELGDRRRPVSVRGVRDGTARSELTWLVSVFNFGCGFRVNGRPLLGSNPTRGLTLPRERNIRRPVASEERYRLTLAKADEADPTGRLACLLALARHTGRRITAIGPLHASDVLVSTDALTLGLGETGRDPTLARPIPRGAIRWRAESDTQGDEDVSPISVLARAALDRYMRAHPRVGDVWMFRQPKHRNGRSTRRSPASCAFVPSSSRTSRPSSGAAFTVTDVLMLPIGNTSLTSTWPGLPALARRRDDEALVSAAGSGDDVARDRKRARKGLERTHFGHTAEGKQRHSNGLGS